MSMQKGNVAIVTGASGGIGLGIAQALLGRGFCVVGTSRAITGSREYEPAPELILVDGDISKRETAERVVQSALQNFGRIDLLINNAGIFVAKPFTEYTEEDYERVMSVNLTGVFHMTQAVVREMVKQKSGHVIFMSAALADLPSKSAPAMLATLSKSPLGPAARGLAIEYAAQNIRFNTVSPGAVNTPMHADEDHTALGNFHPLGRIAEIADVVDAVLYLQSATYVTGENIHVDGGYRAGRP